MKKSSTKSHKISAKDLQRWRLVEEFQKRLARVQKGQEPSKRELDPRRTLQAQDYFSLILFGLFNPVVESMRILCAISDLERVKDEICNHPISLGSFSEAQSVFKVDLLEKVFAELVRESGETLNDKRLNPVNKKISLIDGTLLRALPRMSWALWVDEEHRSGKLHLKYSLVNGVPSGAVITTGQYGERKALKQMLQEGEIYVGDRGYGLDYAYLNEFIENKCGFVFRIRNNPQYTIIEESPLRDEDRKVAVAWDRRVTLGTEDKYQAIRLVKIQVEDKEFIIATDPFQLDADLIALIYRYRWQIELFFKWFKCIFACRHWFAESFEGVAIQLYLTLIASILLTRLLGKRPNKRQMEMIRLYMVGFASLDELMRKLNLEKKA